MTTNERNVDRMIEVIDNASKNASRFFSIYVGFTVYAIITILGIPDGQLQFQPNWLIKLPILGIEIPTNLFFIIVPFFSFCLYLYLMVLIFSLYSLIEDYRSYCQQRNLIYNNKDLYPWIINFVRMSENKSIRLLKKSIVSITVWFCLPLTLFIFTLRYLKYHDQIGSYGFLILMFLSTYVAFWFWNQLNRNKYNHILNFVILPCIIILIVFSFFFVAKVNEGHFSWANLDLKNQTLVRIPTKDQVFERGYWANFEGFNFNGANLSGSILKRANLRFANIVRAKLYQTNLDQADLSTANLQEANLFQANLQEANLFQANLQEANLFQANLQEANLEYANLREANLSHANLQEANLVNADLQEANLFQANLQGVKTLTKEQLCESTTLYETEVEEDLLNAIKSDKDCAYKLTKESYDKWLEKQR